MVDIDGDFEQWCETTVEQFRERHSTFYELVWLAQRPPFYTRLTFYELTSTCANLSLRQPRTFNVPVAVRVIDQTSNWKIKLSRFVSKVSILGTKIPIMISLAPDSTLTSVIIETGISYYILAFGEVYSIIAL